MTIDRVKTFIISVLSTVLAICLLKTHSYLTGAIWALWSVAITKDLFTSKTTIIDAMKDAMPNKAIWLVLASFIYGLLLISLITRNWSMAFIASLQFVINITVYSVITIKGRQV